jgi:hypothetical protein
VIACILLIFLRRLLTGDETFFLRDLSTTHFPAALLFEKLGFARQNPHASFGQAYLPNPNLLVAYRAPLFSVFPSVYLILHLGWSAVGMFRFLRTSGRSPDAAFVGALTFSTAGYTISSLSFLNAATTIAWAPWVLWSAACGTVNVRHDIIRVVVLVFFMMTGEPALIALTLALAIVLAVRRAAALRFIAALVVAVVMTSPLHLMTYAAAMDSARVQAGYQARQALSQSFHPARFGESLVPGIFGHPSALVGGAWWGFRFSGGNAPYLYSVAFGLIPLSLIACSIADAEARRQQKTWFVLFVFSVLASLGSAIPGAYPVYDALTPLHVLRYPVKMLFPAVIAFAVMAATAFDFVLARRHTATMCVAGVIVTLLAAAAVAASRDRVVAMLIRYGWNSSWRSDPFAVLSPTAATIPWHFLILSAGLAAIVWLSRTGSRAAVVAVLILIFAERARDITNQLPKVDSQSVRDSSAFVRAAASLGGRIYERAAKDLDPVRRGLWGRYPADHSSGLAIAQARQGWHLTGAPKGLRYAYDSSPDGSYTFRNQIVQDALDARQYWPYRLKWLRAAGVRGVITANLPYGHPGLELIAEESSVGIPQRLYRVERSSPEYRRVGHVTWAANALDALQRFDSPDFDEARQIVLEGAPLVIDAPAAGTVLVMRETPRQIVLQTSGTGRAVVFVTRSYTRTVRASVDGSPVEVRPANVHLIGVPVPPGKSEVVIRF